MVSDGPKEVNKLFLLILDAWLTLCFQIEMFEWLTRAALELIGQSGFGYSFDPLTEDAKEHPFVTSVKLLA